MSEPSNSTQDCKHIKRCRHCEGMSITDLGLFFFQDDVDTYECEEARKQLLKMANDRVHEVRPGLSETITIMLDSPGGSVPDGFSLFSTIRYIQDHLGVPVDVRVEGWAASMATVLLQAGRVREASPQAMFMLHEAANWNIGKVSEQKDRLKATEAWMKIITGKYASRSAQHPDPQWWADQVERRDWWLTAQEALEVGLIDRIV